MEAIKPKFITELHKIREEFAKEWKEKTSEEVVTSIEKRADRLRTRMKKLREKKKRASTKNYRSS
ncbi:MAG: hypothetical protein HY776_00845 [Actinobacteria bacterium]|nr:hypothetical protein [Actinomycetota bacterium]